MNTVIPVQSMTIRDVLNRLQRARQVGPRQWQACCPAHEDHNPSLSIGLGEDGRVLLTCHAGCDFEAVRDALGFTGLVRSAPNLSGPARSNAHTLTGASMVYDYPNAGGVVFYRVARYEPKDFRPWHLNEQGEWALGLGKARLVPYRLPKLRHALPDVPVLLLEGEKDVDRAYAEGFIATTTQGGAKNWAKHAQVMAQELTGRTVVIIPDADDPGEKYASAALATLQPVAVRVVVLHLPRLHHWAEHGEDLSDWLDKHGGTADELSRLIADATTSKSPLGENTSSSTNRIADFHERSFPLIGDDGRNHADVDAGDDIGFDEDLSSLTRRGANGAFPLLSLQDLAKVGLSKPEELIPGKVMKRSLNITYGDGETGKSYYAQDESFKLAATGVPVWYVAAEGFDGIYLRILAWLATHPGASVAHLRVIPLPVQIFKGEDRRILAAQARDLPAETRPALIVLDTLHRCVVGARESDNSDMVCVANTAALWRSEFGATSWVIHHEGKSAGQGMRGASCLSDDADSVQYVFRGGDISVLECEKQKDAIPRFEPEAYTLESHSLDHLGYAGLSAKVVRPLDSDHIIEARRLWTAEQQRRQPGAKNAVGADDLNPLSKTQQRALEIFEGLLKQHPDGVFKADWRAQCEAEDIKPGSFDWITKELTRRGKVRIADSTGRYVLGKE